MCRERFSGPGSVGPRSAEPALRSQGERHVHYTIPACHQPRPGAGRHRHRPAHGGARRHHRQRGSAAYSTGPRFLGQRPASGSSPPTPSASAACCCWVDEPATCWAAAGCSCPGLLLFSAASFVGGFATSQSWLLAARVFQGAGGALIAPTALALVATNFAEGPARNRAMGVVAAMSGAGAAVGLVAGGLLTTYLSWRWVLFVNAPIGCWRPPPHRWCWPNRPGGGAGSTWAGRSPAPPGWPCWSTACPTPAPISTVYPTGVTTRSWPPWWRRRSCWSALC